MNTRGRYPPGIGGGGGRGGNLYPNPNFQSRNFQQQYVQRGTMQNHQQFQSQQQQQQQQWLRRNQLGADSSVDEVEKTVQSEAVDSSSQDWKARLKMPPTDTRYRTEGFTESKCCAISDCQNMLENSVNAVIYAYGLRCSRKYVR
ncbi:RNAhelicase-like 8 [Actinidia rufa]|uniref:RNAhelicase-like 8 n=1 Tax=Actinidia rufa TaxID=165716 RepID=A0A7J0HD66_9ERIC|nr:RNAhelicase-like 8 [Actinidia rufa]